MCGIHYGGPGRNLCHRSASTLRLSIPASPPCSGHPGARLLIRRPPREHEETALILGTHAASGLRPARAAQHKGDNIQLQGISRFRLRATKQRLDAWKCCSHPVTAKKEGKAKRITKMLTSFDMTSLSQRNSSWLPDWDFAFVG